MQTCRDERDSLTPFAHDTVQVLPFLLPILPVLASS
jgi:hypothetical protein